MIDPNYIFTQPKIQQRSHRLKRYTTSKLLTNVHHFHSICSFDTLYTVSHTSFIHLSGAPDLNAKTLGKQRAWTNNMTVLVHCNIDNIDIVLFTVTVDILNN